MRICLTNRSRVRHFTLIIVLDTEHKYHVQFTLLYLLRKSCHGPRIIRYLHIVIDDTLPNNPPNLLFYKRIIYFFNIERFLI